MSVEVTVCGLHALPGVEPNAWQTGFHTETLAEFDPVVAVQFTQHRVYRQGLEVGRPDVRFLAACVHPGYAMYIDHPGLGFADVDVDPDYEMHMYPNQDIFTVCGVYFDNGQTYSGLWSSHGPVMAYFDAWDMAQRQGRTLLLANVHEGEVATPHPLPFADPSCDTEGEMRGLLRELAWWK